MTMDQQNVPWGNIETAAEEIRIGLAGGQTVSINRDSKALTIVLINPDQSEDSSRFITGHEKNITLEPALPELPLIITPMEKLGILPNQKLDVFVEIPLLLSIFSGTQGNRLNLWETPFTPLSKSFFGSPDNGEIAYSLVTPLYSSVSLYTAPATSAYCPLSIFNRSAQVLDFQRMILRVPYLTLYQGADRIFASPVFVSFRGADQISQVKIRKKPLESDPPLKEMVPPRSIEEKSVLKKSFFFIKNLYNG